MTPMRESLKIIPERTFFMCAKSSDEDVRQEMHKNCNHQTVDDRNLKFILRFSGPWYEIY